MNRLAARPPRQKGRIRPRPPKRSSLRLRNKLHTLARPHPVRARYISFLLMCFTDDSRNRRDGASLPPKRQARDTHPKGGVFSV